MEGYVYIACGQCKVRPLHRQRFRTGFSEMRRVLDLGCGKNKHQIAEAEVIGVDIDPESSADVIYDLNKLPWPFDEDEFHEVICQDILEHLGDLPSVMQEISRISKRGGVVKIRTPHYSSHYAYNNPTHRHYFGYYTFEYFCRRGFKMMDKRLTFPRIWRLLGLSAMVNRYPRRWEQLFAFVIRAENMYIELEVAK